MSIWSRIKEWIKKWIKENIIADEPESPAEPLPPDPTTPPPVDPPTPPSDQYEVKEGERVEKRMEIPCSLSFDMTNKLPSVEDGGPRDNCHLMWAYEKEWGGGNSSAGLGMIVGVRDYALKCYHDNGSYAGQQRYDVNWEPSSSYNVELRLENNVAIFSVNGERRVSMVVDMPDAPVTIGYGWPPGQRPGAEGAILSNIKWEGEEV